MILGSSFEFERHSNPEVQERPSDNVEVPQVSFSILFRNNLKLKLKKFIIKSS